MLNAVILAALALLPDDAPKPKIRLAAMVLDLKGRVEIRPAEGAPRVAEVGDLLYDGERLAVPADGSATLSILGPGARESIKPGSEATVGPRGCTPPGAVAARKEQHRAVVTTMKHLRPAPDDSRHAGVLARAGVDRPQALTPTFDALVGSDRPALAWPAAEGARTYRVKLLTGDGRELWRAESPETRAPFPADKPPLRRGYAFGWEVTDEKFRPVASGKFMVASESELAELEGLKALADSPDRADRVAAALAFARMHAYAEASAAFERLAAEQPDDPLARRALADLRDQAGRPDPGGK